MQGAITDRDIHGTHAWNTSHTTVRNFAEFKRDSSRVSIQSIRGELLRPSHVQSCFATWNVESFTEEKRVALQQSMIAQHIDVLCMQEVKRPNTDDYVTDDGFLVILFGSNAPK